MRDNATGVRVFAHQRSWLTTAAWMTVVWLAMHLVGYLMTLRLEASLGFHPVWFLDCVACSEPAVSTPYDLAGIGGVSYMSLVSGGAAVGLLLRRTEHVGGVDRLWGALLLVATATHVAVTWHVRYPGSLPPVLVAVLLPFLVVVVVAIGLAGAVEGAPTGVPAAAWAGRVSVTLGVVSLVVLRAAISIVVLAACVWLFARAIDTRDRAKVGAGIGLVVLGLVAQLIVHRRFPGSTGWL